MEYILFLIIKPTTIGPVVHHGSPWCYDKSLKHAMFIENEYLTSNKALHVDGELSEYMDTCMHIYVPIYALW